MKYKTKDIVIGVLSVAILVLLIFMIAGNSTTTGNSIFDFFKINKVDTQQATSAGGSGVQSTKGGGGGCVGDLSSGRTCNPSCPSGQACESFQRNPPDGTAYDSCCVNSQTTNAYQGLLGNAFLSKGGDKALLAGYKAEYNELGELIYEIKMFEGDLAISLGQGYQLTEGSDGMMYVNDPVTGEVITAAPSSGGSSTKNGCVGDVSSTGSCVPSCVGTQSCSSWNNGKSSCCVRSNDA